MPEISNALSKYKLTSAQQEIVLKNQNLVRTVIKDKFSIYHEYYEDMMQEGLIGLIKAVCRYEPDKGAQLSTFAYLCIKNEIQKFVSECTDPIRVPVSVGLAINGVRMVEEREGTEEEKQAVLERVAISKQMLEAGRRALRYTSMDADTDEGVPLKCIIPAEPIDYTSNASLEERQLYNDLHGWLNYNYPDELLYNRIFIDYIYSKEQQSQGVTELYKQLRDTYGANRTVVNNIISVYSERIKEFFDKRLSENT